MLHLCFNNEYMNIVGFYTSILERNLYFNPACMSYQLYDKITEF